LVSLVGAGCGSGSAQPTLSAHQVVLALRHHGVHAHTTWRTGVPQSGVVGLLNRYGGESPHVIATVQAASPKVAVLVYDTVGHAKGRLNATPTGIPVRAQGSRKVVGRVYRAANIVLEVYSAAGVPSVSAAVHDLAGEASNA
jgi:hypothetical protein